MPEELSLPALLEVLAFSAIITGVGFAIMAIAVASANPSFAQAFTGTAGILGTLGKGLQWLAVRDTGGNSGLVSDRRSSP